MADEPAPEVTTAKALGELLELTWHRRVRLLALIGGGTFLAGTLIALTLPGWLGKPPHVMRIFVVLCSSLVLLSSLTWLLARREGLHTARVLDLGLVYVVLATAAMAVAEVALRRQPGATTSGGIPGLCLWIVLFPLILPCPPMRAALVALTAASTLPLAYLVMRAAGWPAQPAPILLDWWLPVYFSAGLAVAAAWSLHHLTSALSEARHRLRDLGSYRLLRRLGEGGMGEVWEGSHRLLRRRAAIKLVRPLLTADPRTLNEISARFQREAEAIALLEDPHTVRIFDFGIDENGRLFYAMELLDGSDLEALVTTTGPLAPARTVRLLLGVCASLAEAHAKGLVHRDIKPGNIVCCRPGTASESAKVLDFGIVGAIQSIGTSPTHAGRQTGIAGTPGYIAPEHLLGSAATSPRGDVYAIGAVAFFLLTGRTVFPAPDGGEDLVAHSLDPAPELRSLVPAVSPALAVLVGRCLAKDPAARPADGGTLLAALRSVPEAAGDLTPV